MNDTSWQGGVREDFLRPRRSLQVFIGRDYGDGQVQVLSGVDGNGMTFEVEPYDSQSEHCLIFDDEVARALLDVLAKHFGGTGDTRQLRKDHDAERARVDKLTTALITVATSRGGAA